MICYHNFGGGFYLFSHYDYAKPVLLLIERRYRAVGSDDPNLRLACFIASYRCQERQDPRNNLLWHLGHRIVPSTLD